MGIRPLLFGSVAFSDQDELKAFRYYFLLVAMIAGAAVTALLVAGSSSGVNGIAAGHLRSMKLFTAATLVLWLLLRGHPERFLRCAWLYEFACLAEYTSALLLVPQDEMRAFWFATNIPGVYIILGTRSGMIMTLVTVVELALINPYLSVPYSHNALATLLSGLVYLALFFHVFVDRAVSYFYRMLDANYKLAHSATHDPLTGLLNASAYYLGCNGLIALANRTRQPVAVLFIDLDHFKRINDTLGHAAGDHVLQCTARCIGNTLRASDLLGRVGGEEFSVFLPGTDREQALQVAENIRAAIEALQPVIGQQPLTITASIGVSPADGTVPPIEEIQHQADQAMYCSKTAGRNRVTLAA